MADVKFLDQIDAMAFGELNVNDHQVGANGLDLPHRFVDGRRLPAHLHIGLGLDTCGQALTNQGVVVDDENSRNASARDVAPR